VVGRGGMGGRGRRRGGRGGGDVIVMVGGELRLEWEKGVKVGWEERYHYCSLYKLPAFCPSLIGDW